MSPAFRPSGLRNKQLAKIIIFQLTFPICKKICKKIQNPIEKKLHSLFFHDLSAYCNYFHIKKIVLKQAFIS